MYIHELNEWPNFTWDQERLESLIEQVKKDRNDLFEKLTESYFHELGQNLRAEADVQMLTEEVVKTSEIEGERLDPEQVRSSIARKLGLDLGGLRKADEKDTRNIDGIVNVVLDAARNWKEPLTAERLYSWHASLFPTGYGELVKVTVGKWRDAPIQVVSSPFNKQRVHFDGPAPLRLSEEMEKFLAWFEQDQRIDPILKAGIAHLYFVTIHPFDDGNGRIARAIADLAMGRVDGVDQRFYSTSAQIRNDRKDYYDMLEKTQKGTLDITDWLEWFLNCLVRAIRWAQEALHAVIRRAHVLRKMGGLEVNDRQKKIMLKFLEGGFGEFLNTAKYKNSANCSSDTANRDLANLAELGLLERTGRGRGTSYIVR
jgi:Fic family protein